MAAHDPSLVVVDTHALVWWSLEPKLLSKRASTAFTRSPRIGVPTIVFWEVALLVRKRRLDLGRPVMDWVERICSIRRVEPLPLTPAIAVHADGLEMHPDPADRFIVATALACNAKLVTKDRLIRQVRSVATVW